MAPSSQQLASLARSLALALLGCGCASSGPEGPASVLRPELPMIAPGDSVATEMLFQSPRTAGFVTTLDGSLAPHYHEHHEEIVFVLAGRARMFVQNAWYEIAPGDVVHLPAGVLHAVETDRPCSVVSIFSPPFDGVDRVYLDDFSLPPAVPGAFPAAP